MTRTVEDFRDTYCDKELIVALRETLAKYQTPILVAAGVVIVVCVGLSIREILGSKGSGTAFPNQGFYSDDDGVTWFTDDSSLIPPYDHNGKMAVRALVYECPGGVKFVGVLEKYSDAEKKKIEAERAKPEPNASALSDLMDNGMLAKVPGKGNYVPVGSAPPQIFQPLCEDKSIASAVLIH